MTTEKCQGGEILLQNAWNRIDIDGEYITEDGRPLRIFSPGTWNVEAGPDFTNAKISMDGKIMTGDVEVHGSSSDWFNHRHDRDSAYDNVILHVVGHEDLPPDRRLLLPPALLIKPAAVDADAEKIISGRCAGYFASLEESQIRSMLAAAGMERFYLKSGRILRQMMLSGTEQTCLRMMFEAAGYKRNRECFLELFNRFCEYPADIRKERFEAILWGESGLLPDPAVAVLSEEMRSFTENTWRQWWKIRIGSRPGIDWRRDGGRPVNSPERRIAALVSLYRTFGETPLHTLYVYIAGIANPEAAGRELVKLLTLHDGIWDKYTSFELAKKPGPGAVFGAASALETVVNVVLPGMAAAAKIDGRPDDIRAAAIWNALPSTQDNRITRVAAARWFRDKSAADQVLTGAAVRQGVIHLFQEFCDKCHTDCNSCLIYNSI
ncbi:MAG: DUF2851 family protein [Lentisphaerota bacterium]